MSLTDSVHVLTRPHLATAPDGTLRHAPALLAELRAAVTPGNSGGGSGGSDGPPSVGNDGAIDMLVAMESEARKDYREIAERPWAGDLESLLQRLAEMNLAPEWDTYLARVTLDWVGDITAFLWPVKPRRKLVGILCPSCGFATYGEERKTCLSLGCWDSEGNLAKPGAWDVECAGCEAWWGADRIEWLLTSLNASDTPTNKMLTDRVHMG